MSPLEKDHERGLNGALAAQIRAELGVRKISGRALAEKAGIDRLTLRRYLVAERGLNTAHVEAIANALEMDPSELMARAVARRDAEPELYAPKVDFFYGPAIVMESAREDHEVEEGDTFSRH